MPRRMIPCAGPIDATPDTFPPQDVVERIMKVFDLRAKLERRCGDGKKRNKAQWKSLHAQIGATHEGLTEICVIAGREAVVLATNFGPEGRGVSWWWRPEPEKGSFP